MNPNTNEPMGFGGISHQQTVSDIELGSITPSTPIPTTFLPPYSLAIKMQAQQPDCGANAGAELKQIFEQKEYSEEYLWKKIKLIDNVPIDSGTTLLAIMQTLQKTGVCDLSLLPNNPYISETDFADPSVITSAMNDSAANNKISNYAFQWSPSFQDIKTAIYNHKAVILLMRVGAEFWTSANGVSSWAEKDILPLSPNFPITSGHFVLAYGYDENYIYFINSWSDTWGRKGIGYFAENYAGRVEELGTVIDLSKAVFTQNMSIGSKGGQVTLLQSKLGVVLLDGVFGPITKNAVEKFQSAHGLVADGICGPLTISKLNLN